MIALKSEVRDLLQKLESKERRIHELEGKRPERCVDRDGDGNVCDDQLAEDKLYSIVGRLNEQVRRRIVYIWFFVYTCLDVTVHRC